MNNEIFHSYQPLYLRGRIQTLNEKLSVLTNNTQNVYYDTFG